MPKGHVSYYELLNVLPQDSDETIRRSYNRLALKFHPDRNPKSRMMSQHRFNKITEAYAAIKTNERRIRYNQFLVGQQQNLQARNDNSESWLDALSGLMGRKAKA